MAKRNVNLSNPYLRILFYGDPGSTKTRTSGTACLDERTRKTHSQNMDLGPWPINTLFPNGCMYPGDINGPPEEIINCRCVLMAVE